MTKDASGSSVGTIFLVFSEIFPEYVVGFTAAHNLCYDNEGKTKLFKDAYVLFEKNDPKTPK